MPVTELVSCEHCNQPLEPGKVRKTLADKSGHTAKDTKRHCGFCRMTHRCCIQGLHGETV